MHRHSRHRSRPALRHMNIPTIVLVIIALIMAITTIIIIIGTIARTIKGTTAIIIEEGAREDILATIHIIGTMIPIE